MSSPQNILKKYWGYSSFRPVQEDIIRAVLNGHDVLGILPTGGGKSVCFQVPALMLDGLCIVVSPLIALMKDQVEQLERRGINAMAIYSGMPFAEIKRSLHNAAYGNYVFLYVSPERLETQIFKEYLPALQPSLIVVDEAHCISQWGYDFRPSYLNIAEIRNEFPDTPVMALTASATPEVQKDICERLEFGKEHLRFQGSFSRPNLHYRVISPESKQQFISHYLMQHEGSGIIYAKSRKVCRQLAEWLQAQGISADYYHAGLSHEERNARQEAWIKNQTRVIVCTNAFGMGIDKPDVRFVIHQHIPENLESYYQEAGRAGRDGKDAEAFLLFDESEVPDLLMLSSLRYPDKEILRESYFALMNYLKIDAGVGEGCTRDFDQTTFALENNMSMPQATYIMQTLEQLGIFFMNDASSRPSMIGFITDKESLYAYEAQHPELYELILTMLRNYEGIFDEPVFLRESFLARLMNSNEAEIKRQLNYLAQQRVIRYRAVSSAPEITLLQNRMYRDDFHIDFSAYEERKKKHAERLQQILSYARSTKECRAKIIAHYFGEKELTACERCDNCLKQKSTTQTSQHIITPLLQVLEEKSLSLKEILKENSEWNEHQVKKVLDYLQQESIITLTENGLWTSLK